MEKDHFIFKKLAKSQPNKQKSRLWARIPGTLSLCPSTAHMCKGTELFTLL